MCDLWESARPRKGSGGSLREGLRIMMDKHARLLKLARLRRESRWPDYKCIGDYCEGRYECDFVSPYTRSAGNIDAELMILLQDWSSDVVLSGPYLHARCTVGHDPCRVTNKRLKDLLQRHFGLELKDVYATNVFPFVKLGAISAPIPMRDLVRAAHEFALPQIGIVGPRLAVCLGKAAFDAVALAAGSRRSRSLADAIASPFEIGSTQVWCQAYTGQLGTNARNRRGADQLAKDWASMAAAYDRRVKQAALRSARGGVHAGDGLICREGS
jgi:uracil-DNA glycosylase